MEVTSNISAEISEKLGNEAQRAAAVAQEIEQPWDVEEVPHTISFDERAMLITARDGVTWPADSAEAITCQWLEEHGLLVASKGKWTPTKAGKRLAGAIEEKDEDLRSRAEPSVFNALPMPKA